ncbi:hypothetical protein BH10CYA1_BH10CYA1_58520 [soil metagenome]
MKTKRNQEKHITEQVGRQIRKLRISKGITQLELAVEATMDKSYIVNIESGKANPSLRKIARLADALDVDVVVLFEWARRNRQ